MVVDLQAESVGAPRDRLADPAHADDAEPLAADAVAEHPGRAPAAPFLAAGKHLRAFGETPRHRKDQRHGHVGGVLGENARRIGHGDAALNCGRHIDVVDAIAEIGDQFQFLAGLAEHRAVDVVGHRRHDDVGDLSGRQQVGMAHRLVVGVQARVEQFAHAHLYAVRQLAGHHNKRLLARRHAALSLYAP